MQAKSRGISHVVKCATSVVPIERGCIVGKIGLEDVELSISIEVRDGRAHARLLTAIFVERGTSGHGHISERPITIVVVENAWRAVTSHVDIWPAVIIEIECRNAECVMA